MSRGGYQGGRGGGGFRGQSNFEGGRGGGGGYRGQSNYGPKAPPTFTTTQIPQTTPSPFGQCKDVEIALRKGNQNLLINSYDVQLPKRNVYKYELKFVACSGPNGEREKELDVMSETMVNTVLENQRRICLTQLYFFLFEQQPLFIEAGKKKSDGRFEHLCAYDRGRIFYCTKDLGLKDKAQIFDIDITALTPEIFGRLRMPERVYAAVKQTGFLNPQETLDGLSVATYMDIVFCQPQLDMNDRFIKSGPKVFDINTRQDIGNGCELKNGHQKGVRLVKDAANAQLQIDAKISPFYTRWTLLEYIHSKWGLGAADDLLSPDINAELQQLRGIYVRTTHKTINDVFRIRSVSIVGANQITFDVYGARTNVADYFRTRYNRDLNFPHFPCVIKGPDDKQEFFPLEVLMIEKGQKFPKTKMNSKQEADMIKEAQRTPLVLMGEIESQKNLAGMIDNNPYVAAADIRVSNQMNNVPAQVLKAPLIVFKENGKSVNFAEWNLHDVSFVQPARINAFIVFYHRVSPQDVQKFVQMVVRRARELGMTIGNYEYEELRDPTDKKHLEERILYHRDRNGINYVLALAAGTPFHHILKATEVVSGVVTQQIEPKTATSQKLGQVTIGNIILKMNPKLGGYNQYFQQGAPSALNNQNVDAFKSFMEVTMVMGFYLSHSAPGNSREGEPSVCGYSFSINNRGNVARGGFIYFQGRDFEAGNADEQAPMKHTLTDIELRKPLQEACTLYFEKNGKYPEYVLVYRFGTSDGEIEKVKSEESGYMASILSDAMDGRSPKLIVISVRRQHNTRLFKQHADINGNDRAQLQNVEPGSCVAGTNPADIVMVPHRALQGTAKPTLFAAIFPSSEDLDVSQDFLKNITHALCFMHEIVPSAISVPAPLRSAEQMATRGKNIWHAKREDLVQPLVGDELFAYGTEVLNPPLPTRYWA